MIPLATLLLLLLPGSTTPNALAQTECEGCTPEQQEVLDQFLEVEKQIKTGLGSMSCDLDAGKDRICDFKGICKKFEANAKSPILYENHLGQTVPNYALYEEMRGLRECASTIFTEKDAIPNATSAPGTAYGFAPDPRASLNARIYASVQQHKEESLLVAYEAFLTKKVLDMSQSGLNQTQDPKLEMEEFEKANNQKFSEETRNLLLERAGPIPMSPPPPMQPPNMGKSQKNKIRMASIFQDPFQFPELLPQSAALQKQFQPEVDRAVRLFDDAKNGIYAVLEARRTEKNGKEIDQLKERVRLIRMDSPLSSPLLCSKPNAFYSPNSHSFQLCPQILPLPDAALLDIIVHELGHSIDPCHSALPLLELENKFDPSTTPFIQIGYTPNLPPPEDPRKLSVDLFSLRKNETIVVTGVPVSQNPFKKIVNCLGTDKSVNARKLGKARIKRALNAGIKELRKTGAGKNHEDVALLREAKAEENLEFLFETNRHCNTLPDGTGEDQSGEAFSDWLATEVNASRIPPGPPQDRRKEAFEIFGFFATTSCAQVKQEAKEYVRELKKQLQCKEPETPNETAVLAQTIRYALHTIADSHPLTSDRMNKILFTNPAIREALGCKKKSRYKHCE